MKDKLNDHWQEIKYKGEQPFNESWDEVKNRRIDEESSYDNDFEHDMKKIEMAINFLKRNESEVGEFTKKEMLMFSRLLVEMHWIKRHIFAKIDLKD